MFYQNLGLQNNHLLKNIIRNRPTVTGDVGGHIRQEKYGSVPKQVKAFFSMQTHWTRNVSSETAMLITVLPTVHCDHEIYI